mmetsp:Transcript_36288/g.26920  ORF Transcript_36288/g.26920 Transcript_36288/m.26920 type:complete len:87 (+) Transcript_36288:1757-2017(+)
MICKSQFGACISCSKADCGAKFHAECARRANFPMSFKVAVDSGEVFCPNHSANEDFSSELMEVEDLSEEFKEVEQKKERKVKEWKE